MLLCLSHEPCLELWCFYCFVVIVLFSPVKMGVIVICCSFNHASVC